ncbi:hypothetical protein ACJJTC_010340 [Scirpophaga incertulas]
MEIVNEQHEIVQMSYWRSSLLVSSVYRTIVCTRRDARWHVAQIGTKERKSLCALGAVRCSSRSVLVPCPQVCPVCVAALLDPVCIRRTAYCARPGLRLWRADAHGRVLQTLLFKVRPGALPPGVPSVCRGPARSCLYPTYCVLRAARPAAVARRRARPRAADAALQGPSRCPAPRCAQCVSRPCSILSVSDVLRTARGPACGCGAPTRTAACCRRCSSRSVPVPCPQVCPVCVAALLDPVCIRRTAYCARPGLRLWRADAHGRVLQTLLFKVRPGALPPGVPSVCRGPARSCLYPTYCVLRAARPAAVARRRARPRAADAALQGPSRCPAPRCAQCVSRPCSILSVSDVLRTARGPACGCGAPTRTAACCRRCSSRSVPVPCPQVCPVCVAALLDPVCIRRTAYCARPGLRLWRADAHGRVLQTLLFKVRPGALPPGVPSVCRGPARSCLYPTYCVLRAARPAAVARRRARPRAADAALQGPSRCPAPRCAQCVSRPCSILSVSDVLRTARGPACGCGAPTRTAACCRRCSSRSVPVPCPQVCPVCVAALLDPVCIRRTAYCARPGLRLWRADAHGRVLQTLLFKVRPGALPPGVPSVCRGPARSCLYPTYCVLRAARPAAVARRRARPRAAAAALQGPSRCPAPRCAQCVSRPCSILSVSDVLRTARGPACGCGAPTRTAACCSRCSSRSVPVPCPQVCPVCVAALLDPVCIRRTAYCARPGLRLWRADAHGRVLQTLLFKVRPGALPPGVPSVCRGPARSCLYPTYCVLRAARPAAVARRRARPRAADAALQGPSRCPAPRCAQCVSRPCSILSVSDVPRTARGPACGCGAPTRTAACCRRCSSRSVPVPCPQVCPVCVAALLDPVCIRRTAYCARPGLRLWRADAHGRVLQTLLFKVRPGALPPGVPSVCRGPARSCLYPTYCVLRAARPAAVARRRARPRAADAALQGPSRCPAPRCAQCVSRPCSILSVSDVLRTARGPACGCGAPTRTAACCRRCSSRSVPVPCPQVCPVCVAALLDPVCIRRTAYCARPGLRLWRADAHGRVLQTLLFKVRPGALPPGVPSVCRGPARSCLYPTYCVLRAARPAAVARRRARPRAADAALQGPSRCPAPRCAQCVSRPCSILSVSDVPRTARGPACGCGAPTRTAACCRRCSSRSVPVPCPQVCPVCVAALLDPVCIRRTAYCARPGLRLWRARRARPRAADAALQGPSRCPAPRCAQCVSRPCSILSVSDVLRTARGPACGCGAPTRTAACCRRCSSRSVPVPCPQVCPVCVAALLGPVCIRRTAYCARPGLRLWRADAHGRVLQTLLFKVRPGALPPGVPSVCRGPARSCLYPTYCVLRAARPAAVARRRARPRAADAALQGPSRCPAPRCAQCVSRPCSILSVSDVLRTARGPACGCGAPTRTAACCRRCSSRSVPVPCPQVCPVCVAALLDPVCIRRTAYCARPGLRLWRADAHGRVLQTLLFKVRPGALPPGVPSVCRGPARSCLYPTYCVLRAARPAAVARRRARPRAADAALQGGDIEPANGGGVAEPGSGGHGGGGAAAPEEPRLGALHVFREQFLVAHDARALYVLDPRSLTAVAVVDQLRRVVSVCVNKDEIFVVEGGRSLVRLAHSPEPRAPDEPYMMSKSLTSSIQQAVNTVRGLTHLDQTVPYITSVLEQPISIFTKNEVIDTSPVANAEECFELPPIKHLPDDMSNNVLESIINEFKDVSSDAEEIRRAKSEELQRKLKMYKSIMEKKCDEELIHSRRSRKREGGSGASTPRFSTPVRKPDKPEVSYTSPCLMNVSVYGKESDNDDLLERQIEEKEKILAKMLNLESLSIVPKNEQKRKEEVTYKNIDVTPLIDTETPKDIEKMEKKLPDNTIKDPSSMDLVPKVIQLPNNWNLGDIELKLDMQSNGIKDVGSPDDHIDSDWEII